MKDFKNLKIIIAILCVAGLFIMGYLTVIHYTQAQSFCDLSAEVSCDVVTTSLYSEVFGVPLSFLGLFYFGFVLLMLFRGRQKSVFQTIFLLTLFVLIPSLYLSMIELFVIKSFCILCETSKVIMVAILFTLLPTVRKLTKVDFKLIAPILIAGLVASGITYFMQAGGGASEDYTEVVQCLNQKGVIYYKSVRCSNCRRQEKLLGEAYLQLNAVECHPEGEDPRPEFCFDKGISKTPTFLLEDENGMETDRLEGLQQVESIAIFANCPFNY
jgi:uncharacterized membrane protein